MNFEKSKKYQSELYVSKIMGPNPLKLEEEMLVGHKIPAGATVCDLGSGQGVTSVFLVKEYGFKVYAADLWSEPKENAKFFAECGLDESRIIPVKADACALDFPREFFDAIVCTDSYNYFGRDESYLDDKLLPFLKKGGYIYVSVPGMKKDLHDSLPKELLLSWNEEQLDYIHDCEYWKKIVGAAKGAEVVTVEPMEINEEAWADWLKLNNEYSANDRKSVEAGALKYLNFIKIVLRKM